MGYTHYWKVETPFSNQDRELFTRCARAVIADQIELVGNEFGEIGSFPILNQDELLLNGLGRSSHETFYFNFVSAENNGCKTARKPYDVVVVALLVLADAIKIDFTWSSDGGAADHLAGVELANTVGRAALDPRGLEIAEIFAAAN